MADGNGVDLQAPLSRMWRGVYRKAAAVAEARTGEQLKAHVYVYHPNGAAGGGGGGGGWTPEEDDRYVNVAGDVMSGPLTTSVLTAVVPPVAPLSRVYGALSPAYAPDPSSETGVELGVAFRTATAGVLTHARWYRPGAAAATPSVVRLWDATATAAPVYATGGDELDPYLDDAPGWKTATLAVPQALVAGREYCLAYAVSGATALEDAYTPVPESPLEFVTHRHGGGGAYPALPGFNAFGIDPVVAIPPVPVAGTGVIRLANGAAGVIAWRNAADTADHTLTVSAGGVLVFDGVPLGGGGGNTTMHTQPTAPAGATNSLWFNPSESA